MNLILVICHCKRSASEIRSFDLNRQQGKSFFDNCVDHTLVVCDSVVNDLIQIIIVFDVYLIKVVSIFIRSDFLNGRERAEAGKIIDTEASDKENGRSRIRLFFVIHFYIELSLFLCLVAHSYFRAFLVNKAQIRHFLEDTQQ